jgi:transposase-like protein
VQRAAEGRANKEQYVMRKREKLTPEERFALALALVKREQSLGDICLHYQVSHTTAYKLRNAFLDGARKALAVVGRSADARDPEASIGVGDAAAGSDKQAIG